MSTTVRRIHHTRADPSPFGVFAMNRSSSSSALRFCPAPAVPLVLADTLEAGTPLSGCCTPPGLVVGLIAETGEVEGSPPAYRAIKELMNYLVSLYTRPRWALSTYAHSC